MRWRLEHPHRSRAILVSWAPWLLCGDSMVGDVERARRVEPHLMVTDPPYGVVTTLWRNEPRCLVPLSTGKVV
jgi:hypothetical protein